MSGRWSFPAAAALAAVFILMVTGCESEKDAGAIATEFVEFHMNGDFSEAYGLLSVSAEEKKSMSEDQYVNLYDSRFTGASEVTGLNFSPQKRGEGSITLAFTGTMIPLDDPGTEYTLGGEISLVEEPEGWKVTEFDWVAVPTGTVEEFQGGM